MYPIHDTSSNNAMAGVAECDTTVLQNLSLDLSVDAERQEITADENAISLELENRRVQKNPDGGVTVYYDLLQTTIQNGRSLTYIGGTYEATMRLIPANSTDSFPFTMRLTNGDFMKGVDGFMICERNNALLPDLNYEKWNVHEYHSLE